jgi:GTPase
VAREHPDDSVSQTFAPTQVQVLQRDLGAQGGHTVAYHAALDVRVEVLQRCRGTQAIPLFVTCFKAQVAVLQHGVTAQESHAPVCHISAPPEVPLT